MELLSIVFYSILRAVHKNHILGKFTLKLFLKFYLHMEGITFHSLLGKELEYSHAVH